jgi:hypothetical protein
MHLECSHVLPIMNYEIMLMKVSHIINHSFGINFYNYMIRLDHLHIA